MKRDPGKISKQPKPQPAELVENRSLAAITPYPQNARTHSDFVGSGTTIVAAEMTGRACHAIEIGPAYVDVSIERWQNFTGEQATLGGQTFDQVKAERLGTPEHQSAEAAVSA